MKTLGLYLGINSISLVEVDVKNVVNRLDIALPKEEAVIAQGGLETVPENQRILNALRDGLKKIAVSAQTVNVVVAGRDLVVRSFSMPILPPSELASAIRFEAKKYIPFKLEEMVFDFRFVQDRLTRKVNVIFVGIKKDIWEQYVLVLKQCNLKAVSLEYAGFASLRLLQVAGIKEKEVVAIVNANPQDDDEVNFLVVEDGFPLFNRDMLLSGGPVEPGLRAEKLSAAESAEKLKIELRMSLDFYLRRFATKAIKKIIFLTPQEYSAELDAFVRTRGLTARFLDLKNYVDNPGGGFSLGFYKAFSGAAAQSVPMKFKMDLLAPMMVDKQGKGKGAGLGLHFTPQEIKFNPGFVLLGFLIIVALYALGWYPQINLRKEIEILTADRAEVQSVNPEDPIENLEARKQDLTEKLLNVASVVNNRFLATAPMDGLPRIIPEGVWLRDFSLHKTDEGVMLVLQGVAYLKDGSKETERINKFMSDLSQDPRFKSNFPDISLTSTARDEVYRASVTSFVIECRGARKK